MTADRPVSARVTPADVMVEAFQGGLFVHFGEGCEHAEAGVAWAECCVRAGIGAVVPLLHAQIAAELHQRATDAVATTGQDVPSLAARIAAVLGRFDWRYDYAAADIERAARAVARELDGEQP